MNALTIFTNPGFLQFIGVEGGFTDQEPEYDEAFEIVILPEFTSLPFPSIDLPEKVRIAVDKVILAESADRKQQLASWVADKKKVSAHAMDLKQLDNGVIVPPTGWKCSKCDKTENLWLNLTDGMILCGRRLWDGSGGNNHAIEHYEQTKYPLAVKLGTITADLEAAGNATRGPFTYLGFLFYYRIQLTVTLGCRL
jgi:ubiquitin carboxyl-terminal hydrolase 5/13